VKKFLNVCSILAVTAVLLLSLGACDNGDSGPSVGRGVLGQVTGVLYDTVTLQPIEGAEVEIGGQKKTTDKNGYYVFKDVGVGTQTVTLRKDGYRFETRTITVDPGLYITDDPFKQNAAFTVQIAAFAEYWHEYHKSKYPEYVNLSGGGSPYTGISYQDGVFVTGDGTAVTITNDYGKDEGFKFEEVKLDYTYKKFLPLHLEGLVPLSGALKGTIRLFKGGIVLGDLTTKIWNEDEDTVLIDEGIEIWFKDDTAATDIGVEFSVEDYSINDNPTAVVITPGTGGLYGPFKTGKNGTFHAEELPAGPTLTLTSNAFTKDGYFYTADTTVYKWNGTTFGTVTDLTAKSFPETKKGGNTEKQGYTEIGELFFFSQGKYALITDFWAGSGLEEERLEQSGEGSEITITFSEEMDPVTFGVPTLTLNANAKTGTGLAGLIVKEWNEDFTTVTLVPDPTTNNPQWPLSKDGEYSIGNLLVSATLCAKSGAIVYNRALPIPVYTKEGLRMLSINIAPDTASIPARVAINTAAIEITFNKAITEGSTFKWGDAPGDTDFGTQAYWSYAAGDESVVYVYTDVFTKPGETVNPDDLSLGSKYLQYFAIAKDNPNDQLKANTGNYEKFVQLEQQLILKSTDLYTGKEATDTYLSTLDPGKGTKLIGTTTTGPITLTFYKAPPAGSIVEAILLDAPPPVSGFPTGSGINTIAIATPAFTGADLIIAPKTRLNYDTPYYIAVRVKTAEGYYIFNGEVAGTDSHDSLTAYDEVIVTVDNTNGYNTIAFQTETDPDAQTVALQSAWGTNNDFFTLGSTSIASGTKELKIGTPYYIQLTPTNGAKLRLYNVTFSGAAPDITFSQGSPVASIAVKNSNTNTTTSPGTQTANATKLGDYTLTLTMVADDVLGVTVTYTGAAADKPIALSTVSGLNFAFTFAADPTTPTADENSANDSYDPTKVKRINTTSGTLSISNIRVEF